MRFQKTRIEDVWIVEPVALSDSRGSFARTFCKDEFAQHGLVQDFVQHSVSHSREKHTIRGLHFQKGTHAEDKVVSCLQGAIFDVAVDVRPDSPTYLQWVSALLSSENRQQFYIPKGFAHGFQSLTDDAVVSYLISTRYEPSAATGLRFDDPAIGIDWPAEATVVSEKDRSWPLLAVAEA